MAFVIANPNIVQLPNTSSTYGGGRTEVGVNGIYPCDLSRRSNAVGITKTEAIPVSIKATSAVSRRGAEFAEKGLILGKVTYYV